MLRYLFNTVDHISTADIKTIVTQSLSAREGDFIMTLAERLQKEGFEKGIQQGMQQGVERNLLDTILKMHCKGMTVSQIADILELRSPQVEAYLIKGVQGAGLES